MSCLFDALALHLPRVSSPQLRQLLAQYELTDPVMPDGRRFSEVIAPVPLRSYHRWIAQPNSWGGAPEIAAFCRLLQVEVRVRVPGGQTVVFAPGEPLKPRAYLRLAWNGSHFSAA